MEAVDAELRSLLMHDAFVRSIARGLVTDSASVDDIAQETWWRALKRNSGAGRPILPWLAKVTRHLALNTRRAEHRRRAREVEAAVHEAVPSTAAIIEREAVRRSVVEGVLELPEPLRDAVVLRYFEGLPPREIARRTREPVETVRSRLKRALSILRVKLAPVDAEARKSFGAILLAIAHGPRAPVIATATAAGKAALLGALAMTTGTKIATAVAALFLIVGLIVVPPYFASHDREAVGGPAGLPSGDAPSAATKRESAATIRPRPSPGETPANERTDSAELEVELIGPGGRPSPGARLLLHRGKEFLALAITNAEGLAGFRAAEGEAGLIVLPEGAPVHFATLSLAPGRRQLRLPPGHSISGRVELTGEPPTEPIKLRFWPMAEDPLLQEFQSVLKGEFGTACSVGSSGDFELVGLTEGSEWRMQPATGAYRIDEITQNGRPLILLTAPATGIVVKLRRLPVIRGRIVSADGAPLEGSCVASLWWQGGSMSSWFKIGETGRFFVTAANEHEPNAPKITRVEIVLRGPKDIGEVKRVLDPSPDRDLDLGDIELSPGRTIRYVVTDSAGKPIEGAFARFKDDAEKPSRTGSDGRGEVLVDAGVRSIHVGALKYEVVEVQIPSDTAEVLPITLQPNAGLEVRVSTNPGTSLDSLRVRLSAPVRDVMTSKTALSNDGVHVAGGASANAFAALEDYGTILHFAAKPDGHVVVAGLKPGVPLTLAVLDALDHVLVSTTATLGPAEWKTVDLHVTKTSRSFKGKVLDPSGQPVAGARAVIHADPEVVGARGWSRGNGQQISATTDEAGRFVLSGIFESPVHFAVDKPGFVPLIRRDFALPAEDVEVAFTLQKGCELVVKVVDDRGAPIRELESISAEVTGYPQTMPMQKQPGEYVFSDFPVEVTAMIRIRWADRDWSRSIAVKADHTERIEMSATGTLVVDYSAMGSPPFELRLEPGSISRWIHAPAPGAPRTYEVAPVLPGEYTATLYVGTGESPERERRFSSQAVRITAGQPTRIAFRKP